MVESAALDRLKAIREIPSVGARVSRRFFSGWHYTALQVRGTPRLKAITALNVPMTRMAPNRHRYGDSDGFPFERRVASTL